LRVRDLTISYGGEPVLEGVSLSVGDGRFVSLVGPSGSGKSSLLRAVIGLQQPLSGTVETNLARSQVGILFQDDALLPWKTSRDNVALGLTFNGMERSKALAEAEGWLDRLDLAGFSDRFPRRLSGGQRKRVALAQVLAMKPKLILMDEPFASLDAIVRARGEGCDRTGRARKYQRSSGHPRSRRGAQPLRRGLPPVAGTACAHHATLFGADSAAARSGPFAHASRLRAAFREAVGGPLPRS
jgi:ABC-type lipoprotein export system ATPase subunit